MRNWLIGHFIFEFEQDGNNRATYGEKTLEQLSNQLKTAGIKGFSTRSLRLYRQFYMIYPQIWQSTTAKLHLTENETLSIRKSTIAKLSPTHGAPEKNDALPVVPIDLLLDRMSFTHFIELLRIDDPLKRAFYEIQTTKNNWTVELLKRNINSMLYERVGLSSEKGNMLEKLQQESLQEISDVIRNPYVLDFLGLEEKSEFSETDLEQAIITHLQKFLIEMGRGFCFEARQKRITFNNRHYRIDLVFYHRILKCHVLIDLKLEEFDHADAGQMNVYLNYFAENEISEGDKSPIGIILCSQKDNALVHYATGNLPQEVFVSQYLLELPTEKELKAIIATEIQNAQRNNNSYNLWQD